MANLKGFDHTGQEDMDEFVFDWTSKLDTHCLLQNLLTDQCITIVRNNGSITAEHGVGTAKVNYMKRAKSSVQLELMRTIKNALDPNGIMNPYKVIPEL